MTTENKQQKNYYTTYDRATKWLHNNLILCNNITEIDPSVYDYFRFDLKDEEGNYTEIFQWFITDCSESDVEYLEKSFNLLFVYSPLLDKYILCVDHWGTSWDNVPCEVNTSYEYAPKEDVINKDLNHEI